MNWFEALVLAVVQGLTEFLPVSSSGHLVIAQTLFGIQPSAAFLYDIVLHLGTALAALVFYRRDVAGLLRGLVPPYAQAPADLRESRRLLLLLAAATAPTAAIGFAFKDFFEGLFAAPGAVVAALGVTGAFLVASALLPAGAQRLDGAPWWKGVLVGVAQAVAIVPGISRSGSTIVASLAAGIRREDAVRFSFLLSLPAILGASLLELRHLPAGGAGLPGAVVAAGFTAAAATGYLAILFVLRWTREGKLWQFGLYCWAAAALAAVALARR
ncbi:MAG TPA: undecaprenyl-diphosphate phosphatase [bacterium]